MGKQFEYMFLQRDMQMANTHMNNVFNIISHERNANQSTEKYHFTPIRMTRI